MTDKKQILVQVSHRHVHLARKEIDVLFGKDYRLKKLKQLNQPEEFAAEETVTLINDGKKLERVRVIGPGREQTQIELSRTDANELKMNLPLRESGDLDNTPGIEIKGPQGKVIIRKGVILAKRHLHASESEANEIGLKDGDLISIKIPGKRGLIFNEVMVRINAKYKLAVHLDREEGNAAGVDKEVYGKIIH
tara:strand:+ start:43 stop:621 length:579 start_codon:yes stop_codon:yes gene_type:complete